MNNYLDLGLTFQEDFLTIEEENHILEWIGPVKISENTDKTIRNSIKRYGEKSPYHNGNISKEIPLQLQSIIDKLLCNKILETKPKSVSINEFLIGQGMKPHIDNVNAGPIITTVSLKNSATIVFRKKDEIFSFIIPPRALVQMKDEIRTKWTHEILPAEALRYSIVFRCI